MQLLGQFISSLQRSDLGPTALLLVSISATYLLARGPRIKAQPLRVFQGKSRLMIRIVRWTILVVAVCGVLFVMGIDLRGLWSVLGAALSLVAIGFVAMWSILSHMLAAFFIVVFRPFEADDHIEIVGDDPIVGRVIDLNLVYTTLRTTDGGTLRIPNNLFFQKVLKRHAPAALINEHPLLE